MEEKKPYGLRRTRAAARDVYICERFVKGFTRVNGLGFATLQSSNDASLEHIHKDISVMSMGRSDLSRREKDYFNQTFSPKHIGKIFRLQRRLIAPPRVDLPKRPPEKENLGETCPHLSCAPGKEPSR